nr:permease-like cell division protein FtsX [uncultured Cetobacterium sp.]
MGTKKIKGTFIVLILSFMIFNLFVSIASNSYFIGKKLKDDYFFTIELKNNIDEKDINEFEKFLLSNPNVKGIRFLDKDEAFRNLQKELEIVIPKSENPLPNSMIVKFENEKNIQAIQELLDVDSRVREIYIDSSFLQSTQRKVSAVNTTLFLFSLLSLATFYIINVVLREMIFKDYMIFAIRNPQNSKNYLVARNKNLIPFFVSAVIGSLIYFNIYTIIREKLNLLLPDLILQSFKQLFYIEAVAMIVVLGLSWKMTKKIRNEV